MYRAHAFRGQWIEPGFGDPGWTRYGCRCGITYTTKWGDPPREVARSMHRYHLHQMGLRPDFHANDLQALVRFVKAQAV
jgi:hypothetical protein